MLPMILCDPWALSKKKMVEMLMSTMVTRPKSRSTTTALKTETFPREFLYR
jgi:hypothetical protein